ncbi:hypothetical protein ATCC90586_011998 [Pythium insidiosum]|nr:hypothetical protein ATCC90586_011998 [Pythium insidiosum]
MTTPIKCTKCKKTFKNKRNLKVHQGRRVCKETRNPRLRAARLAQTKDRARSKDAARKRAKYVKKLPECEFCVGVVRAWVHNANCPHRIHRPCFIKLVQTHTEVDPVFGRRPGPPRCPMCRAEWVELL